MKIHLKPQSLALLEASAAITLWAISFVFVKITLREISPVTLIVVRFLVGALLAGAVAARRGEFAHLRREDLPPLALAGLVGITGQQFLQVSGQALASASVAAVLASTAPAFIAVLAVVFLRERLRLWQTVGVVLASAGAFLVATNGDLADLVHGQWGSPGSLLLLGSSLVWAVFTLLNKRLVRGRPTTLVTASLFFFGALFALPIFIANHSWRELAHLSPAGWSGVAYISILSTAVAYLVNSHALKQLSAARVGVIQNLEPLIAVAAAAVFLGERLTPAMLLGGAAILLGVYLAEGLEAEAYARAGD